MSVHLASCGLRYHRLENPIHLFTDKEIEYSLDGLVDPVRSFEFYVSAKDV